MLQRIRKAMEEKEEGFTLIELLVVVIIIGILAAIAIPTFLNQREGAWKRAAESDLRNNAVVMETFFSNVATYAGAPGAGNSFKQSQDVTISLATTPAASTTRYCLEARHAKLGTATDVDFHLDSNVGRPETGPCPAT